MPPPGAQLARFPAVFASPARYIQGPGALAHLDAELGRLGCQRPVVIHDPVALKVVKPGFLSHARWLEFGGECSDPEIERLVAVAQGGVHDGVVAIGGGKTIDTGKMVASRLEAPLVVVPTIASTDAPTSGLSVIYNHHGEIIEARFHRTHPALVLVDSEVIVRAPTRFLVAGMGDSLATWFEARASAQTGRITFVGGRPLALSLSIAQLCYEITLEHGVAAREAAISGVVTESVERVIEANTLLSGLGFENVGVSAAHAIHNGLARTPAGRQYWHGEKVVVGLVAMLMMNGDLASLETVVRFCLRVGLPVTLADLGLDSRDDDILNVVAERACDPGDTMTNEPRAIAPADVVSALRGAEAYVRTRFANGSVECLAP